jgi:hypothetical protein
MSELSPDEPFIATAGADPGRRKAAAHEARSAPQSARGGTAPDKFEPTKRTYVLPDAIQSSGKWDKVRVLSGCERMLASPQ